MSDTQLDGVPAQATPLDTNPDASTEEVDYDSLLPEEARLIELVGYLVQGIVAHPEDVEVEEFFDDAGTVYGVRVHPDDIGRVIGREGRVASALRLVVKAAATKTNMHVTVEVLTEDGPEIVAESSPKN